MMKSYLKVLLLGVVIACAAAVCTVGLVYAQGTGVTDDPGAALNALLLAWKGGGWMAALGVAVGFGVRFLRPYAAKKIDWFRTGLGGYVFTFLLATLAGIGEALTMGELSWRTAGAILVAALSSLATTPGQDERTEAALAK